MARENYNAHVESSWKDLTAREKFILKDVSAAMPLDEEVSPDEGVIVTVSNYVRVAVHNEKSDSKDYVVNIIVDPEGNTYRTGSDSFANAMEDIRDYMSDEGLDEVEVRIYKKESPNYKGKHFITATLA